MRPTTVLIALMTAGHPAVAQPASRNGNVWGGVAHQPNLPIVRRDEKARGILAPPQEQARWNAIVDRIARELLS
jgi:hypothetical protein